VLLLSPFEGRAGSAEKETYVDQLVIKARSQKLWLERDWQALMHYNPNLLGNGVASLIDDESFFLSKLGKISPQAELESTLRQLFASEADDSQSVGCRFPARLAWLVRSLEIDRALLPQYQCSRLSRWLQNLNADGLTLVFPVSVLNSPASMFGHTFLRFDRKNEKRPDLLAWTVSYAAYTEGDGGLGFALKGLFGGYPGRFGFTPYHARVKAYSDIENRDIWEYELNYSQVEIDRLLLHLWELLPIYADYYFIDENCSYQLLALLDVARPELNLTQQFDLDATPAETVRAITNTDGLLKRVDYRPSLRKVVAARAENLARADQALARGIALGEIPLNNEQFKLRGDKIQAAILELASDYAVYLSAVKINDKKMFEPKAPVNQLLGDIAPNGENSGNGLEEETLLYQLLMARSKIRVEAQEYQVTTPKQRPDQGHRGRRVGFRYGYDEQDHFLQMDLRWAYHDLYDPPSGFTDGAELSFIQPAFRYYADNSHFQLEALDFVSITSAPVREYFIRPYSWEASAGLKRYQLNGDDRPLMGDFRAGFGVSYQLTEASVLSLFANTAIVISDEFDPNIAFGGGGRAEVISTITDSWQMGLYGRAMQYFEGVSQTSYEFGIKQRFTFNRDGAVVLDIAERREFDARFLFTQLSLQLYF